MAINCDGLRHVPVGKTHAPATRASAANPSMRLSNTAACHLRRSLVMRNSGRLFLALALASCTSDDVKPITDVNCVDDKCAGNAVVPGVAEARVFPQLSFNFPVQMVFSPQDKNRAFVVEHSGKVQVFDTNSATSTTVALDLTGKVHMNPPPHNEAGLNAI